MSDDDVSRAEFMALKERVRELETRLEATGDADGGDVSDELSGTGLDDRDKRVLHFMREHGRLSKRRLVQLYISQTDIQNRDVAKRRAKNLERMSVYQNL